MRVLTFVLNGYLLRRLSKDTIGLVNVRYDSNAEKS